VSKGARWVSAEASGEERKASDAKDTLCSYSDVSPAYCVIVVVPVALANEQSSHVHQM
jgi:hypothetical protein